MNTPLPRPISPDDPWGDALPDKWADGERADVPGFRGDEAAFTVTVLDDGRWGLLWNGDGEVWERRGTLAQALALGIWSLGWVSYQRALELVSA